MTTARFDVTDRIPDAGQPRPVILTFLSTYLPGYKAGGPLRTIYNMTEALSGEYHFKIVTSDRDAGDLVPYPSIRDSWQNVGKAEVRYLSKEALTLDRCKAILETTPHDVVYFQSCFSPFTIRPLLAMKLRMAGAAAIVAPRGELYPGALSIKRTKKIAYLLLSRLCGLYARTVWQASSEEEAAAIRKWFGKRARVMVAPDLAQYYAEPQGEREGKLSGHLKVLFFSRISPKKNLAGALHFLRSLDGEVEFDIVGPAEDAGYWEICRKLIADLPANIKVSYRGAVPHEEVARVLAEYELLLLPTLGENFGHVIIESFLAGCPVLISDQTPWRELEKAGAGWDLPLDKPQAFADVLRTCVNMDENRHRKLREGAWEFGRRKAADPSVLEANRSLLMTMTRKH
jgi:glycosyltransferase involved in cell wall biosynthesis